MQSAQITKSIDDILARHLSHPSNYAAVDCVLCMTNAAYHIQQEDKHTERSREILQNIPVETINDAIREVSTALGDDELVRPLSGGLKL